MANYPFPLIPFINDNRELVKKYINKDTMHVDVGDIVNGKDDWYNGNCNIRKAQRTFEYTDLQKLEYIKCLRDIVYFTKKYIKIISVDDGVIPFMLYDYQEELLRLFQKSRFTIACQCRQSGKTQTTAAHILHYTTFNPSKVTAILANKAAQAREILARVQMSYEELPFFLKQGVVTYNKGSMLFENKSEAFCAASTSSSIRGRSIALLYIDEAAFLLNDFEFFESTYPVISSGKESRVIITSTPNGARGLFHKLWSEALEGQNLFQHIAVPWYKVPGRDENWKNEQVKNTSIEQFNQEHGLVFRGSQNSLLSSTTLETLIKYTPVQTQGDVKIYTKPEKGHQYIGIVDTARGLGGDFSAVVMFDITQAPYRVVATYKNNRISPLVFPQVIKSMGDQYNQALLLVEINDIGEQVANILYYDFEYENLLMCFTDKNVQQIGYVKDAKVGVRTTVQVKSIGCSNVKTLVDTGKLEPVDADLIEEFGTFIPVGRSYQADTGAHDDLVMCCVIFAWAVNQQYIKDLLDKDISVDVREAMKASIYDDLMPFGIFDNGNEEMFVGFEKKMGVF